jgi:hypothetical protein
MDLFDLPAWLDNWMWSLPLIVLTIIVHVLGLALIHVKVVQGLTRVLNPHHTLRMFSIVMAAAAAAVTALHGVEASAWAGAFWLLDALPDYSSAMLFSLGAMTSHGHANVVLADRWQLMGALEALNGLLLFGLTTAYLFAVIQDVWRLGPSDHKQGSR